jgi:hypothetical protein
MDIKDIRNLGDKERIAVAKQLVSSFKSSLPKELHANAFTLKSKLPYKATSLREVLMHRFTDIANVSIDLFEADMVVPAFIEARAAIETTALLYCLHKGTADFLRSRDADGLNNFLNKGLLGSKDGLTVFEPHHVLKTIDRLDKEFSGLREMYDRLCEFAHPNWSGTMGAYSKLDTETYVLHLGKNLRRPPLTFGLDPLIYSIAIFEHYYNALADDLKAVNEFFDAAE